MITFESHKNKRGWTQLEIYKDGVLHGAISRKRSDVYRSGYVYSVIGHKAEYDSLWRIKDFATVLFGAGRK